LRDDLAFSGELAPDRRPRQRRPFAGQELEDGIGAGIEPIGGQLVS
jgi:hypothetical protein